MNLLCAEIACKRGNVLPCGLENLRGGLPTGEFEEADRVAWQVDAD